MLIYEKAGRSYNQRETGVGGLMTKVFLVNKQLVEAFMGEGGGGRNFIR